MTLLAAVWWAPSASHGCRPGDGHRPRGDVGAAADNDARDDWLMLAGSSARRSTCASATTAGTRESAAERQRVPDRRRRLDGGDVLRHRRRRRRRRLNYWMTRLTGRRLRRRASAAAAGERDGARARPRRAARSGLGSSPPRWAMVDGPTAAARQLRLLHAEPELAAQADQGGNLPLHYAASAGVKPAVAVACALAFPGALSMWPTSAAARALEIAELEGHRGVASVLSGLANHQRNEPHDAFAAGAAEADEQLRLLRCRPESPRSARRRRAALHVAARAGAGGGRRVRAPTPARARARRRRFLPASARARGGA